jgi:hypothetical protein
MAENRLARELENRTNVERPQAWAPASALPEPDKQPGYEYRWVRVASMGQSDAKNVSSKMREGWEPVKAVDHPELMLMGSEKTGNVEIGGLMLCKMPTERFRSRQDYYNNQAQGQMDSVDNHFLRNNDPRMPLFAEKKSSTTRGVGFGSGSK